MTLDTRFYITTPGIDPDTVWHALLDMVETRDTHLTRDEYTVEGDAPSYGPDGTVCRVTRVGAGLSARCFMYYSTDGSEIPIGRGETDNPAEEDWEKSLFYVPRAYIRLGFDTAYGYHGHNGEGCSQLHGRIVTYLAGIVTTHGGEYVWKDEYTGEWHTDLNYVPEFGRI